MLKVNYRITDSIEELNNLSEQEIEEGGVIEGYFELVVNNQNYGYFKKGPLQKDERWSELITTWFEGLLTILLKINNGHSYVVISDIDSYNTWIEFKTLKNKNINVSVIEADKKDGSQQIETTPPENIVPSDWANEEVSYDQMHHEITKKATEYIAEVATINPQLANGATFVRLKKLLRKAKNLA